MRDSTVIDKLYAEMLSICSTSDINFEDYRGGWGPKLGAKYQNNFLGFIETIRRMAKLVPVKYYNNDFYMFDGRIYVIVKEELIVMAYDLLLEHLRIVPMIGNRSICMKYFVNIIRYFNLLNPRPDLVAFLNGVLDLKDYRFYPFSPEWHVTYYHPYEYNETAKCNKWKNFLHEVLPDRNSRLILQMFLGLGLMERGSVYNAYEGKAAAKIELCLILIGSGANGKSTIYDTAVGIFGKERISGLDYDDLTASGDEGMRARLLLRDALFNWSSDSDQRSFGRKRTGVFKRIVSGESVTVRKLGENVKENYNIPFLIFNLNELPYSDDQSLGFIRRLQFISFEYVIPKEKQNPNLSRELVSEYSGIFNWIVRGAKELKRRKFIFPDSEGNRRQILLSQLGINPVVAWINSYGLRWEARQRNEICTWIKFSDMVESIENFCRDNNADLPTIQKIGQTLGRANGHGFYKERRIDGIYYQVYGCVAEALKRPFIIADADLPVEDATERDTFIMEDD